MKTLKLLVIVATVMTFATHSFAQTFGVKAGLNLSNQLEKDDDDTYSDDYKANLNIHIGVTVEIPLSDVFAFETGLLLSSKGYRISEEVTDGGDTYKYEGKTNLAYLEVPLTGKLYFDLGGTRIYGAFGPYIGLGIGGKHKYEVTYLGEKETEEADIKWGSDEEEDEFRALDYGLNIGAGLEISAIQVGVTYGLGLANISSYTEDGSTTKNRVIALSVAYRFGRN